MDLERTIIVINPTRTAPITMASRLLVIAILFVIASTSFEHNSPGLYVVTLTQAAVFRDFGLLPTRSSKRTHDWQRCLHLMISRTNRAVKKVGSWSEN
jgi:hypothetical protein